MVDTTAGYFISNGAFLYLAGETGYPTSADGLPAGAVYSNEGFVCVVPGVVPDPGAAPVLFPGVFPAQLLALGGGNLPLVASFRGGLYNDNGFVCISAGAPPLPNGGSTAGLGLLPWQWQQTVISQYANSPVINQIIASFAAAIDPAENINSFFSLVWNVDTAEGYGLDVWGRIVGVKRTLTLAASNYFGFAEANDGSETGFNQAPFFSGATLTTNYDLTDDAFRTLIYAKALANICDGSIPAINQVMLALFPGRGDCYVSESIGDSVGPFLGFAEAADATNETPFNIAPFYNGNASPALTMRYVFTFPLSAVDLAIVQTSGVLPRPAGVAASVLIV